MTNPMANGAVRSARGEVGDGVAAITNGKFVSTNILSELNSETATELLIVGEVVAHKTL